ncbi:hypothetical protein ACE1CI_20935 [Aerosakkonemataceae cyanobacterium BLCC-F50]|uniref:Uncharacterized protein n=1 Tax=Floridaenema flaviceps BLCC-F50 TaxID=3153642 RepID=A0ABV4XVC9_9CYAN
MLRFKDWAIILNANFLSALSSVLNEWAKDWAIIGDMTYYEFRVSPF